MASARGILNIQSLNELTSRIRDRVVSLSAVLWRIRPIETWTGGAGGRGLGRGTAGCTLYV